MLAALLAFAMACCGRASQTKVPSRDAGMQALTSLLLATNLALAGIRRHASLVRPRLVSGLSMQDVGVVVPWRGASREPLPLALFLSEDCIKHDMGPGHPERPERLSHLIGLAKGDWSRDFGSSLRIYEPRLDATYDQLRRVHTEEHLRRVQTAFETVTEDTPVPLDGVGDTVVHVGTKVAALRAAGLVVAAVDEVLGPSSIHSRAFVLARPPGHHAEPDRAMGFCIFNNVMVGVAHAEAVYGMKRIAILDFDVHHGNGDQAISTNGVSRFYGSTHQAPMWPNTGPRDRADQERHIFNIPLPAGAGSDEFREAWCNEILPAVVAFSPDMVFLSAGFDAHRSDPIASMDLTPVDFEMLTYAILDAVNVPLVSVLEGGYDIDSLGKSARGHVDALVNAPVRQPYSGAVVKPRAELEKEVVSAPNIQSSICATKEATRELRKQWFESETRSNANDLSAWRARHQSSSNQFGKYTQQAI